MFSGYIVVELPWRAKMKLFHITVDRFDSTTNYFVFADTSDEAEELLVKKMMDINPEEFTETQIKALHKKIEYITKNMYPPDEYSIEKGFFLELVQDEQA